MHERVTMLTMALLAVATSITAGGGWTTANSPAFRAFPSPFIAAWYWPFSSSTDHKQLQAANERINDLVKLKTELELKQKELHGELKSAKAEVRAALQQASEKHKEEIERLKR